MIEIRLSGVKAGVVHSPEDGQRIIVLQDQQSGITILAPFEAEQAREIAAGLTGIVIATGEPNGDVPLPFERQAG